MHPVSRLGFNILSTHRTGTEDDADAVVRPSLQLNVELTLDGAVLKAGEVFDALAVVVHGTEPGPLDPFTCSCGNAGCAGIFENVHMQVDPAAGRVTWLFPEDYFRKVFQGERWPAHEPLRVVFDLRQYQEALGALEQDLATRFATSAVPVTVLPDWSCERSDAASFAEMLARSRAWHAQYLENCRKSAEAEGALRQFAIRATLPQGQTFDVEMTTLAWALVVHLDDWDEQLVQIRDSVGPALLANPLGHFAGLTGAQRRGVFWADSEPEPDDAAWELANFAVIASSMYPQGEKA